MAAGITDGAALEQAILQRLRASAQAAGLWDELQTDWLLLDAEILPWSLKAEELLRRQYAAAGAAAGATFPAEVAALQAAVGRGLPLADLLERTGQRQQLTRDYMRAYRHYVRRVSGLEDIRVAPFHLLASEGHVHSDKNHLWHLGQLAKLAQADAALADPALLMATQYREVNLSDPASEQAATDWWLNLTAQGGEGMVVKSLDFVSHGKKGLNQPAVKVRGQEYLRLIYGPEYTRPANLERLRARGLAGKRALALRELVLGLEGLDRFVRGEPLWMVHECVFGVAALGSGVRQGGALDPRL